MTTNRPYERPDFVAGKLNNYSEANRMFNPNYFFNNDLRINTPFKPE